MQHTLLDLPHKEAALVVTRAGSNPEGGVDSAKWDTAHDGSYLA